jgi:hypothetical protein
MVLIWGLRKGNPQKGTLSDHDAEMQRRSRILLRDLDEKKEKVIVPAVTVAELLCPLDPREHGEFIAVLTQRFFCPPFDIRAASLAAELWQYNRGLPSSEQISRTVLKADVLIISSARVGGASVFYSHDGKCRKLAVERGQPRFPGARNWMAPSATSATGVGGSLNSGFLYFSLPYARPLPVKSRSCTSCFGQWSPDSPSSATAVLPVPDRRRDTWQPPVSRTAGSGDPRRTSTICGDSAKSLECPVMRSPWSCTTIGRAPW